MEDKKILIIGEESKHVGLAHSLKNYYSNVCTKKQISKLFPNI